MPRNGDGHGDDGHDDDVFDEIRAALDELDIGSAETRDALVDGVREAVDQVRSGFARAVRPPGAPDLRVVHSDEPDADPDTQEHPRVRVHVVDGAAPTERGGVIAVPSQPADPATTWQTVFHGSIPRVYRITAREGTLEVSGDDAVVARISPPQTTDVEAKVIRARAIDGPARGSYAIL